MQLFNHLSCQRQKDGGMELAEFNTATDVAVNDFKRKAYQVRGVCDE